MFSVERQDCNFDIPDVSKMQQKDGVDMCKIIILVKELDLKKCCFAQPTWQKRSDTRFV